MRGFQSSNGSLSNQFVPKLLDSQAFSVFVQENGPPYRRVHLFDEVGVVSFFQKLKKLNVFVVY